MHKHTSGPYAVTHTHSSDIYHMSPTDLYHPDHVWAICVCIHASTHMCVCVNQKWVTSDTDKSLYGPQGCIIHSSSSLYFYLLLPLHPLSPHSCVGPVESGMWSATWSKQRGKSLGIFVLNDHAVLSLGPLSLSLPVFYLWMISSANTFTHLTQWTAKWHLFTHCVNLKQYRSIVRLADGSVS